MKFDASWDKRTGVTTGQVLAGPVLFKTFLLGVIQVLNRRDGQAFSEADELALEELSKKLGIALYNQKRMAARGKTNKFEYLLENHIVNPKELTHAISSARQKKMSVETFLMKELKVSKKDIGNSLSRYYDLPFVEFNKNIAIPGELLVGLKVPFMRNNVWVPLRTEEGQPVIAIDDPHDLQKIDEIKALFPGKNLKFCVALKQDILDLIRLFTQSDKELAEIDEILSQLPR